MPASEQFKDFQVNLNAEVEKIKGKFTAGTSDAQAAEAVITAVQQFNDAMEMWDKSDDVSRIPVVINNLYEKIDQLDDTSGTILGKFQDEMLNKTIVLKRVVPLQKKYGEHKLSLVLDVEKKLTDVINRLNIAANGGTLAKPARDAIERVVNKFGELKACEDEVQFQKVLKSFKEAANDNVFTGLTPIFKEFKNITAQFFYQAEQILLQGLKRAAANLESKAGTLVGAEKTIAVRIVKAVRSIEGARADQKKLSTAYSDLQEAVMGMPLDATNQYLLDARRAALPVLNEVEGKITPSTPAKVSDKQAAKAQAERDAAKARLEAVERAEQERARAREEKEKSAAKTLQVVARTIKQRNEIVAKVMPIMQGDLLDAADKLIASPYPVPKKYSRISDSALEKIKEVASAITQKEFVEKLNELKYVVDNIPDFTGPSISVELAPLQKFKDDAKDILQEARDKGFRILAESAKDPMQRLHKVVEDLKAVILNQDEQLIADRIIQAEREVRTSPNPSAYRALQDAIAVIPSNINNENLMRAKDAALPVLRLAFDSGKIPKPTKPMVVKETKWGGLRTPETAESKAAGAKYDAEMRQYQNNKAQLESMEQEEQKRRNVAIKEARSSMGRAIYNKRTAETIINMKEDLLETSHQLERSIGQNKIATTYLKIANKVLLKLREACDSDDDKSFKAKLGELSYEIGNIPDFKNDPNLKMTLEAQEKAKVDVLQLVRDNTIGILLKAKDIGYLISAKVEHTDTQRFLDAVNKLDDHLVEFTESPQVELAESIIASARDVFRATSPESRALAYRKLQNEIASIPADTKDDALRRVRSAALPLLQEAFKGVKRTRAEKEELVAIEEIESEIREEAASTISRFNRGAVARKELKSRQSERESLLGNEMGDDPIKPQEPKKPRINYGTRADKYKADMAQYKKDLAAYEREMSIRHGADTTKEDTEEKDKAVKTLVDKASITGILPDLQEPTKGQKETKLDYNKRMIKYRLQEGYFLAAREQLRREEKDVKFMALAVAEPILIRRAAEDVVAATDVRKTKESAKLIMNELKSNLRMELDYNVELMKIEAELNLLKQGQKKLERSNIYAGDLTDRETSLGGRRGEILAALESSKVDFQEKRARSFASHAESTLKSSVRTDLASPNAIDAKKAEIAKVADIEMALLEKQMLEERMKELKQAQAHAKQREDESEYYDLGRRSSSTDAQIARREIEVLKAAEKALQKQIDGVLKGRVAFKALASHEYKHLGFKEEMIPIEDQIKKEREASYKAISQAALDSTAQFLQAEPADVKKQFTKDLAAKEKLAKERAVVAAKIVELNNRILALDNAFKVVGTLLDLNQKEHIEAQRILREAKENGSAVHKQWMSKKEFHGQQTQETENVVKAITAEQQRVKEARERELEIMPPEQQLFARINDAFKENLAIGGDRNAFKDKAKEIFAKEYEKYLDGSDLLTMDSRERFREMFNSSTDVGKKFDKELDKSYERLTKELKQSLKKPGVLASVISSKYTLYAGKAVAMIAATAFVSGVPMLYHKLTESAAQQAVAVGAADELARKFAQSDAKLKETQKAFDKFVNSDAVKKAINSAMPESSGASPIKLRNELWGIINDAKNALNNPDSSADVVQKAFNRIVGAYHMKKIGVSGMFQGNSAFNSVVSDISSRSSAAALLASAQGKLTAIARPQALFSKGQNAVSDFFAASGSYITSSAPYIRITSSLPIAAVADKLSSVAGASTVAYAALLAHTPEPVMQAISKAAQYFPKEALSKIPLSVFASTIALGLKPHVFTIGFAVIATACGPVSVGAFLGHVATGIVTSLAYSYVYGAMLGAMKWAGVGVKKGANIPDLKELAAFVDKEVKAADKKVKAEIGKAVKEAETARDDMEFGRIKRTIREKHVGLSEQELNRRTTEELRKQDEVKARKLVEEKLKGKAVIRIEKAFKRHLERRNLKEIRERMMIEATQLVTLKKELKSLESLLKEQKEIDINRLDDSPKMQRFNEWHEAQLEVIKSKRDESIASAKLSQQDPQLATTIREINALYEAERQQIEGRYTAEILAFRMQYSTEEGKLKVVQETSSAIEYKKQSIQDLESRIKLDEEKYEEGLKVAQKSMELRTIHHGQIASTRPDEAEEIRRELASIERGAIEDAQLAMDHYRKEKARALEEHGARIDVCHAQLKAAQTSANANPAITGLVEDALILLRDERLRQSPQILDIDINIAQSEYQPSLKVLEHRLELANDEKDLSAEQIEDKKQEQQECQYRLNTESLSPFQSAQLHLRIATLDSEIAKLNLVDAINKAAVSDVVAEINKNKASLEQIKAKILLDSMRTNLRAQEDLVEGLLNTNPITKSALLSEAQKDLEHWQKKVADAAEQEKAASAMSSQSITELKEITSENLISIQKAREFSDKSYGEAVLKIRGLKAEVSRLGQEGGRVRGEERETILRQWQRGRRVGTRFKSSREEALREADQQKISAINDEISRQQDVIRDLESQQKSPRMEEALQAERAKLSEARIYKIEIERGSNIRDAEMKAKGLRTTLLTELSKIDEEKKQYQKNVAEFQRKIESYQSEKGAATDSAEISIIGLRIKADECRINIINSQDMILNKEIEYLQSRIDAEAATLMAHVSEINVRSAKDVLEARVEALSPALKDAYDYFAEAKREGDEDAVPEWQDTLSKNPQGKLVLEAFEQLVSADFEMKKALSKARDMNTAAAEAKAASDNIKAMLTGHVKKLQADVAEFERKIAERDFDLPAPSSNLEAVRELAKTIIINKDLNALAESHGLFIVSETSNSVSVLPKGSTPSSGNLGISVDKALFERDLSSMSDREEVKDFKAFTERLRKEQIKALIGTKGGVVPPARPSAPVPTTIPPSPSSSGAGGTPLSPTPIPPAAAPGANDGGRRLPPPPPPPPPAGFLGKPPAPPKAASLADALANAKGGLKSTANAPQAPEKPLSPQEAMQKELLAKVARRQGTSEPLVVESVAGKGKPAEAGGSPEEDLWVNKVVKAEAPKRRIDLEEVLQEYAASFGITIGKIRDASGSKSAQVTYKRQDQPPTITWVPAVMLKEKLDNYKQDPAMYRKLSVDEVIKLIDDIKQQEKQKGGRGSQR